MKRVYYIPTVFILVISFGYSGLMAQERWGNRGRRGPGGPEFRQKGPPGGMFFGNAVRMKEELGLSDDQIEKIGDINLKYEKKLLKFREKLAPKKIRLRSLIIEDNVDLSKVRSLLSEVYKLKLEIRMLRIEQRLEIEKVLTKSQKSKLSNSRMRRPGRGRKFKR